MWWTLEALDDLAPLRFAIGRIRPGPRSGMVSPSGAGHLEIESNKLHTITHNNTLIVCVNISARYFSACRSRPCLLRKSTKKNNKRKLNATTHNRNRKRLTLLMSPKPCRTLCQSTPTTRATQSQVRCAEPCSNSLYNDRPNIDPTVRSVGLPRRSRARRRRRRSRCKHTNYDAMCDERTRLVGLIHTSRYT